MLKYQDYEYYGSGNEDCNRAVFLCTKRLEDCVLHTGLKNVMKQMNQEDMHVLFGLSLASC